MPMFRLLWKKDKTEYKSVNTSQVENENDVQIKNGKRQKEEPQSHKKSEMMLAAEKRTKSIRILPKREMIPYQQLIRLI